MENIELEDYKSFIVDLNRGHEFQFNYNGKGYSITYRTDGKRSFTEDYKEKTEQLFDDNEQLLKNLLIEGKLLSEIFDELEDLDRF